MSEWCGKRQQRVQRPICEHKCKHWKQKNGEWYCNFQKKMEKLIEKHEELDRVTGWLRWSGRRGDMEPDYEDNPLRGVMVGLLISLPIWAAIVWLVWG